MADNYAVAWDALGEHLYETGVDHGVYYPFDATNNVFTGGVAWNGLTAVNESPSGAEPNAVYADNIKYLNLISAEDYGATIECLTTPPEFDASDGKATFAKGATLGMQERKLFGFCYRTLIGSDTQGTAKGYKLHIVYNATASPSEKNHSTVNDSPEANSMSYTISTTPVDVTGFKPTAYVEIDSTKCDSQKLTSLLEILYGTSGVSGTEARLPYPAEILTTLGAPA